MQTHQMRRSGAAGLLPILALLSLPLLLSPMAAQAASASRASAFQYDPASGLLVKEIVEPDDPNLCLVTEYSYDAYGNKLSASTRNCNGSSGEAAAPAGLAVIAPRTSSTVIDARGQFPISNTNALNQSESKTYDARFGVPLSLTGPNGLTTTWTYDSFGRKTKEIRADGTQTKWDYLYCSGVNGGTATCPSVGGATAKYLIQETPLAADGLTPTGPVAKAYYDALERKIRSESQGYDGSGTAPATYQDTWYDSLGRVLQTSRPYQSGQTVQWTVYSYDSLGRVIDRKSVV